MPVLLLLLAWCAVSVVVGAAWALVARDAQRAELTQRRWDDRKTLDSPLVLAA